MGQAKQRGTFDQRKVAATPKAPKVSALARHLQRAKLINDMVAKLLTTGSFN